MNRLAVPACYLPSLMIPFPTKAIKMYTGWTLPLHVGLLSVIITALFPLCSADEFTSPSNSKSDLTIQYTLGQTVQLSWNCSLSEISVIVSHWGGNDVGSLLSKLELMFLSHDKIMLLGS